VNFSKIHGIKNIFNILYIALFPIGITINYYFSKKNSMVTSVKFSHIISINFLGNSDRRYSKISEFIKFKFINALALFDIRYECLDYVQKLIISNLMNCIDYGIQT
jgi:hypothetical protein